MNSIGQSSPSCAASSQSLKEGEKALETKVNEVTLRQCESRKSEEMKEEVWQGQNLIKEVVENEEIFAE